MSSLLVRHVLYPRPIGDAEKETKAMTTRTDATHSGVLNSQELIAGELNQIVGGDTAKPKSQSSGTAPSESLSINFTKITFTYFE
jgi:hypothetical protein